MSYDDSMMAVCHYSVWMGKVVGLGVAYFKFLSILLLSRSREHPLHYLTWLNAIRNYSISCQERARWWFTAFKNNISSWFIARAWYLYMLSLDFTSLRLKLFFIFRNNAYTFAGSNENKNPTKQGPHHLFPWLCHSPIFQQNLLNLGYRMWMIFICA